MGEFGGAVGGSGDLFTVTAELSHQTAERCHLGFELAGGGRVGLRGGVTEYHESCGVPCGDTWRASGITDILTPAVFRGGQAVVAGEAIEFGVFRPGGTAGAAGEALQAVAQLHTLSYRPLFCAVPGNVRWFFPVPRHHGAEKIEFEGQVRMAGRDHLVIDGLFLSSDMAVQAGMAAYRQVAQIAHA